MSDSPLPSDIRPLTVYRLLDMAHRISLNFHREGKEGIAETAISKQESHLNLLFFVPTWVTEENHSFLTFISVKIKNDYMQFIRIRLIDNYLFLAISSDWVVM